jgi:hypothetical protein
MADATEETVFTLLDFKPEALSPDPINRPSLAIAQYILQALETRDELLQELRVTRSDVSAALTQVELLLDASTQVHEGTAGN